MSHGTVVLHCDGQGVWRGTEPKSRVPVEPAPEPSDEVGDDVLALVLDV